MHIDWWTLALETINFLILVWLLQRFLYKPVMGIVARRRQEMDAAFADAEDARRQTEAEATTYREKIAAAEAERLDLIQTVHAEMDEERTKMLAEARQEADELLSKQRQAIATERTGALEDLREGAADLAVSLATTLLREAANGSVAETFLERLRQRFLDLSAAEKRAFARPGRRTDGAAGGYPAGADRRATTALARATLRNRRRPVEDRVRCRRGPHRRRPNPLSRRQPGDQLG